MPSQVSSLSFSSSRQNLPDERDRERSTPAYSPWLKKPLSVVYQQEALESQQASASVRNIVAAAAGGGTGTGTLGRHLTVWDLIGVGVGSSVGSGIFVLTGQIASQNAGPWTFLSFTISGLAACLSGVCYAELSGRIPAAGSTYVYAYVCLGEVAAVVAASCLTLEYAVSGAAVARSWGDKIIIWLDNLDFQNITAWLDLGEGTINLPACLISLLSTLLLLSGVQESKTVTNAFTALKMVIVTFMVFGAFLLFDPRNKWTSSSSTSAATCYFLSCPPPYGWKGVFRGATSSFFGYLGYDEICCVAGEAINPSRDIPRAVLGTLFIVTVCYVVAALALTGMVPYQEINPTSGFPDAFMTLGYNWASQVTAIGELVCLPVVVLLCLMVQPRLTLSMAHDGLLPRIFSKQDSKGNLSGGILVCGLGMTAIATFCPFTYLDDLISAGILVAFSMTNACLVLMRCESPTEHPGDLEECLLIYNAACFLAAIFFTHDFWFVPLQFIVALFWTALACGCVFYMSWRCPKSAHFGGNIAMPVSRSSFNGSGNAINDPRYFKVPFVPYLPCLGMAVNWYLVAQLDALGTMLLFVYLLATVLVYLFGCAPHSLGHRLNWTRWSHYEVIGSCSGDSLGNAIANVRNNVSGNNNDVSESDNLSCDSANGGGGSVQLK